MDSGITTNYYEYETIGYDVLPSPPLTVDTIYDDYLTPRRWKNTRQSSTNDVYAIPPLLENSNNSPNIEYEQLTVKEVLDWSNKGLDTIPDQIVNSKSHKALILDGNHFQTVPENLMSMDGLRSLSLASQMAPKRASLSHRPALQRIPDSITKLRSLQQLILYNNAIQQLPQTFSNLSMLCYLDLRLNELRSFPLSLCNLKSLQELYLSGNHIETLPAAIEGMKNLLVLRISNNSLKSLPEEVCTLTKLTSLALRGNKLQALPTQLYKLKGLLPVSAKSELRLLLEDNPLKSPPTDIVAKGTPQVFSYLQSKFEQQTVVKPKPPHLEAIPKVKQPKTSERKSEVSIPASKIESLSSENLQQPLLEVPRSSSRLGPLPPVNLQKPAERPIPTSSQGKWCKEQSDSKKDDKYVNNPFPEAHSQKTLIQRGYTLKSSVPKDGNSFFESVADQLKKPNAESETSSASQLRKQVVQYFEDNKSDKDLKHWIQEHSGKLYDEYVDEIRKDGATVDRLAVHIMARVLHRGIHIVTFVEQNEVCEQDYGIEDGEKLILGDFDSKYYQSLSLHNEVPPDTKSAIHNGEQDLITIAGVQVAANTTTLDLSDKMLEELPEDVRQLKNLSELVLNNNCLSGENWVLTARELPSLQRMSARNQVKTPSKYQVLEKIPETIKYCQHLTQLCLSHNKICALPVEVTCLTELRVLDLICNFIPSIPDEIQHLKKLEYLGLSDNKICSVPASIGQLSDLQVLRLSHNQLEELPDTLCNLENLIVLSLSHNQLCRLPIKLYKLEGLTTGKEYCCNLLEKTHFNADLSLESNNDMEFPPKNICKKGKNKVLSFLKEMDNFTPQQKERILSKDSRPRTKARSVTAFSDSGEFQHLNDKTLLKLAEKIGKEWQDIGTNLNVDLSKMQQYHINHPRDVTGAILEMLIKWRNRNIGLNNQTEGSLLIQLADALGNAGRSDLNKKILAFHRNSLQ